MRLKATEVIALAAAEEIELSRRGTLVVLTPPRRASPALREAVQAHKAEIYALLADGGRSPPSGNGRHSEDVEHEKDEDARTPEKTRRTRRHTFAAPDLLGRSLLHVGSGLGDAELRVYLFLVFQTMGWGKDCDRVSHAQIRDGIRRRNGEVWSTGTGLATRTIINALHSLVERKLISCTSNNDPKYGHVANTYALILEASPEAP
jgi:hypothetical protein